MKRSLFLIPLMMIFVVSCATSEIKVTSLDKLPQQVDLKNLPTQEQNPKADGVVLYNNTIYDVDYVPNVGIETYKTQHVIFRVFRNADVVMKSALAVDDKTVFESFSARTIKPDGTIINLKEDDIYYFITNLKTKGHDSEVKMARYNFPQLKDGDLVELKYTIINKNFFFGDRFYFQNAVPVKYSRLEVNIPNFVFEKRTGLHFKYKARNIELKDPVITESVGDTGDKKFVWEKKDIPQLVLEPGMGDLNIYIGHLDINISPFKKWKDLAHGQYDRFYGPVVDEMTNEEEKMIGEKLAVVTKDLKTEDEKIAAIYHYVQTYHYDMTHVYFGHGMKPNRVKTIMDRGYGDCKDHAVLMLAMLKEADIKAFPVLIGVGDSELVDPKFVGVYAFNHVLLRVYPKVGKPFLADPTSPVTGYKKTPFMDSDSYLLELRPKKDETKILLEKTLNEGFTKNYMEVNVTGNVKKKAAVYEVKATYHGAVSEISRAYGVRLRTDVLEKFIRAGICKPFYNAKITDIKIENLKELEKTLTFSYIVTVPVKDEFVPVAFLKLPTEMLNINQIYVEKRTRPLKLWPPFRGKISYDISFDPNVFRTMIDKEKLNKTISFDDNFIWKTTAELKSGKLLFSGEYTKKANKIPAEKVLPFLAKHFEATKQLFKFRFMGFAKMGETAPEPEAEETAEETKE